MPDVLNDVIDLIKDSWNGGNVDNYAIQRNVIVDKIINMKRADFLSPALDYILVYSESYITEANAIGRHTKKTTDDVAIDIRSMTSREHATKVVNEVERIMDANIINPTENYDEILITRMLDLSDKSKGLYRYVITVRVTNHNKIRGS